MRNEGLVGTRVITCLIIYLQHLILKLVTLKQQEGGSLMNLREVMSHVKFENDKVV